MPRMALIAMICSIWCAASWASIPEVRVRLATNLKEVIVRGMDMTRQLLVTGETRHHPGQNTLKFNCDWPVKSVRKNFGAVALAEVSSPTGGVVWNDAVYRGGLHITSNKIQNGCELVNVLPLEQYLIPVLAKEMRSDWPIEALKAQAVAARTYALYRVRTGENAKKNGKDDFFDLEHSEKYQVGGSVFDETRRTASAAKATEGEILVTKRGKVVPIFYHSQCSGKTYLPEQVWDSPVEGYKRVDCPYEPAFGRGEWTFRIQKNKFSDFLSWYLREAPSDSTCRTKISLTPAEGQKDEPKLKMYTDTGAICEIPKSSFRKFFGTSSVRSNFFSVTSRDQSYIIHGEGEGHGVGMGQYGAYMFAKQGWSYKKILAHYYPGFKLTKAW